MEMRSFEYEVAFSFCAQDEGIAQALDDRLRDRFNTFLYSRKQSEIASSDGEKTFNAVFGEKARVAVILYRAGWGQTPFTRIEETAIRNRGYDEGYDFTVWIAVETGAKLPRYVGAARLYYSIPRFGLDGALAVIESAIERAGGETRPETLEEKAQRLNRQNIAQAERVAFLRSPDGVKAAEGAGHRVIEAVAQRAACLTDWQFKVDKYLEVAKIDVWVEVIATDLVLSITWHKPHLYDLDETELRVEIFRGRPLRPGRMNYRGESPPRDRGEVLEFDRTLDGRDVWRRRGGKDQLTEAELVDHALAMFLDTIHAHAMKPSRR